jgi:hypothetical protein
MAMLWPQDMRHRQQIAVEADSRDKTAHIVQQTFVLLRAARRKRRKRILLDRPDRVHRHDPGKRFIAINLILASKGGRRDRRGRAWVPRGYVNFRI